jgi:hypothetical protein
MPFKNTTILSGVVDAVAGNKWYAIDADSLPGISNVFIVAFMLDRE